MIIDSDDFNDREKMPEKFTADGDNISPQLTISEIPDDAKSLVLIIDDPDAERVCGHTWVHWVVFDIDINGPELVIPQNSIPGIQAKNSGDVKEYEGPNPPVGSGVHNYFFKAYALDKKLNLPEMTDHQEVRDAMKGHVLELYEYIGEYWRKE